MRTKIGREEGRFTLTCPQHPELPCECSGLEPLDGHYRNERPFPLHTASNQELDGGKAWERGVLTPMNLIRGVVCELLECVLCVCEAEEPIKRNVGEVVYQVMHVSVAC